MRSNFRKFIRVGKQLFCAGKASAFFIYGGVVLCLASWALLFWLVKNEQAVVILHYNAFMGIDAIVDFNESHNFFQVFPAPIGGTFIFVLNLIIACVLCFQSQLVSEQSKERRRSKSKKTEENILPSSKIVGRSCQNDINLFGAHLVLAGGFLLQLIVFLYTIAIISVNR